MPVGAGSGAPNGSSQKPKAFALALVASAGQMVERIPRRLVAERHHCRSNASRICHSGFFGIRKYRRPAASGRSVWIYVGWSGVRAPWIFSPTRNRAHFRDLTHDRRDGRGNGRGRPAKVRTDRHSCCFYRSNALLFGVVAALECAGQVDQRQRPCRLQGWRWLDHRHDATAQPFWRSRRRP